MKNTKVIIIAAMEEEITPFLAFATSVSSPVLIGNAVHRGGVIFGQNALFVQGGIGLVNAAGAATSALLACSDSVPAPLVISAGSAGGLGASVRVGEVVVGTEYINADADARAFGYELGQVPGMPASYKVPESLLALVAGVRLSDGAGPHLVQTVHQGLMVSSYSFVGAERAAVVKSQFADVLSTDMESSAIAQICHSFGVPFLAIRGISDLCGPASDADFLTHVDDAAARSAEVSLVVVEAWFKSQASPTN